MFSYDSPLRRNARLAVWGVLVLSISLVLHFKHLPYAEDDAYIHMRMARHLWAIGQPFFNPGEPVMASTAPLWLLITAPAAILGASQPLGVACLNTVVLTAASWIWGLVFARFTRKNFSRPHFGSLLVTFVTLASSSISLMETPLAMMLTGIAYLGVFGNRWWGIPVISLAPFVRPECIVFACAILLYRILSKRSWSGLEVVASLMPVSLLIAFELYFFGSVIPHTAQVKDIVYDISAAEFIRFFFLASYGSFATKTVIPFAALAAAASLVVLILKVDLKKEMLSLSQNTKELFLVALTLSPSVIIFTLYAFKHVLIFPWYTPLVLVPVHLGCLYVLNCRMYWVKMTSATILAPLAVIGALLVGSCIKPELAPFFESGARARQLRLLGTHLYSAFPGARVMAPEIGAFGFSFKGRIIDAIGLVSPEALAFHPMKVPEERPAGFLGSVPVAFVEKEKPELMIGLRTFFTHTLTSAIVDDYDVIERPAMYQDDRSKTGDGVVFGSRNILIFRRKGLLGPDVNEVLDYSDYLYGRP
jgi:hypothetical protein